jgi:rfaE bifunctional protein kinase chain/domain/rfaE bifunctional protein nucleotidyltransferase chain/domain|tara:strand:+ start:823 stop:2343 length:1521 start_codon:yes stop_codon:yes gene_type:complete
MKKIYSLEKLAILTAKIKNKSKSIVLCHGVFDLLHVGHIKHLIKAKEFGDKLVVTITSDNYVNKGPGKPLFNQRLRTEAIAALEIVDYVAINDSLNAVKPIRLIKPNVYCKGKDYNNLKDDVTGEIRNELHELKKIRGKVVFTHELTFSSSRIINSDTDFYSNKHKKLIKRIKQRYNFESLKKIIEDFNKLKILVIGETIIDQYSFCEIIGKSGKEPMLVLKEINTENYLGGVLAIAKNLFEFSKNITILSMIGEKQEFINEIKNKLPKNIKTKFFLKKNSSTIIKKRYVDSIDKNKILGVYNINDDVLNKKEEKIFNKYLKNEIKKYDLVIVSDYGHGIISKSSAIIICKYSKFLALNAQINAFNIGYHTMKNYRNFNTLIINEKEIRHEMRDKVGKLENLIINLANEKSVNNLIVTKGRSGSILYNKDKKIFFTSEAYATKIIDKIGAGDTMLSLMGLCLKSNIDSELALLISSLGAAKSVESLANKESINKINMLKTLENFFK